MKQFKLPSPAMTVACIALAVALSGASYAAIKLPANSVGTKQLKRNAVTSAKVKDSSLRALDFAPGQLPAGPQGPAGAAGANGATNVVARVVTADVAAGAPGVVTVNCAAGERATGGGGVMIGVANEPSMVRSYPSSPSSQASLNDGVTPTAWTTRMHNPTASPATLRGYAICAAP